MQPNIRHTSTWLVFLSVTTAVRGVSEPTVRQAAAFAAPWQMVFADSELTIGLDTSRIARLDRATYRVWLQTRWATPRTGSRKRTASPFNREMIHAYLQCSPVAYKVIGTVVSLNDGPPLDSIVVGDKAARSAVWNVAKPNSADVGAGERACTILQRRRADRLMRMPRYDHSSLIGET